jgi:hypothetical protein
MVLVAGVTSARTLIVSSAPRCVFSLPPDDRRTIREQAAQTLYLPGNGAAALARHLLRPLYQVRDRTRLLYLPAYSPDFNSIKLVFAMLAAAGYYAYDRN